MQKASAAILMMVLMKVPTKVAKKASMTSYPEGSLDGLSNWIDEGMGCLDKGSRDGSSISVKIGLDQAFEDGFEDG
jgi:hypothetical protein